MNDLIVVVNIKKINYKWHSIISYDKTLRLLLESNIMTHCVNKCTYINNLLCIKNKNIIFLSKNISFSKKY